MRYDAAVKSARMAALRDVLDADVSPAAVVIGTAGMDQVICRIPLAMPCGVVAGDTLTLFADREGVAEAGGDAAEATITDGGGTVRIMDLSVGEVGSGAAIEVDNTDVKAGQRVILRCVIIQHAR